MLDAIVNPLLVGRHDKYRAFGYRHGPGGLNQTLAINRQFPFIDLLKFYDVPAGVQAQNRADDDLVPVPPGR